MASPTLVPRFGGQSYRKLITVTLPLKAGGAKLRLLVLITMITDCDGDSYILDTRYLRGMKL